MMNSINETGYNLSQVFNHPQTPNGSSNNLLMLANDCEYTFQLIFDQYCNRVYNVAMLYLRSAEQAREVVQEVFMKFWQERKNINNGATLEAWLYNVAKNITLTRLKIMGNEQKKINI